MSGEPDIEKCFISLLVPRALRLQLERKAKKEGTNVAKLIRGILTETAGSETLTVEDYKQIERENEDARQARSEKRAAKATGRKPLDRRKSKRRD